MMGTKLNAQIIIKNLQNMHDKSLPPTGARRRMELRLRLPVEYCYVTIKTA